MILMTKKTKRVNKKINKKLDKLLSEKKKIEDIPASANPDSSVIKKNSNVKKSPKKKEAIVVAERKPTKKKTTTKKKEAIVVTERKPANKKKPIPKKKIVVPKETKEKLENNTLDLTPEETLRMTHLEEEMRSLYDQVEKNETIEPKIEDSQVEEDTTLDTTPEKEISEDIMKQSPVLDSTEQIGNIIADIAVRSKEEEETPQKRRISAMAVITIILAIIFTLLLIAFIAFLIYVCTY